MGSLVTSVAGVEGCRITRCGYTGEDGVEISIPEKDTAKVTSALLESKTGTAQMTGLGARDSLRLEAGLCLYGNDIDETTSPVEAGLTWTIGKRRRQNGSDNFPGANIILNQIREKPSRKRIGLISKGQLNSELFHEIIISPKMQTKNYRDFCPTIQTRIVALFFDDFLVSVGSFFWLRSLFVW